jgi:hypothetical protein
MATLLRQLLSNIALESDDVAAPTAPVATDPVEEQPLDADATLAEQVVAEVNEIDKAVTEHDTTTESVQALESLALALESTIQSGRGYTALEMALHDSAVTAHYKLIGLARPQAPAMESFTTTEGSLAASQLALESLTETTKKVEVALESLVDTLKNSFARLGTFMKDLVSKIADFAKRISTKAAERRLKLDEVLASKGKSVSMEWFGGKSEPKMHPVKYIGGVQKSKYQSSLAALVDLTHRFCTDGKYGAITFMMEMVANIQSAVEGKRQWKGDDDIIYFAIPERMSKELPGQPSIVYTKDGKVHWTDYTKKGEVPYLEMADVLIYAGLLRQMSGILENWGTVFGNSIEKIYGTLDRLVAEADKTSTSTLKSADISAIIKDVNLSLHAIKFAGNYISEIFDDFYELVMVSYRNK